MSLRSIGAIAGLALLLVFSIMIVKRNPQWSAVAQAQESDQPAENSIRFLTGEPNTVDYWPCFSPDGRFVLFSRSTDNGKTWEFFIVPSAGGQAKRFSPSPLPVSATRPHWSTTHNVIAFTGLATDGSASVWTINSDGSHARQVVLEGVSKNVYYPSWYPDGQRLAVVDFEDEEKRGGVIKQINLKDGTATPLTDRQQVLAGMPSVSPDGEWIAFAGQRNEGQSYDQSNSSIWLIGSRGHLRQLETRQGRTPAWAPDGKWLAFESNRNAPKYAVFVIDQEGKSVRQITSSELNTNHPVWSPDGKFMAFSALNSKNEARIAIIVAPKRVNRK